MLQYKIIDQPNQLYNYFVASHPSGHLFQSYQWGELKRYNGWRPWRIAMQQNNKIISSISFLQHPSYGGNSLLYAPRGPVIDFSNVSLIKQLLEYIEEIAQKEKAIFLKIDPTIAKEQYDILTNLKKIGFQQVTKEPEQTLQKSQVYRISLPSPNNLVLDTNLHVDISDSLEMLKVFYAILLEYGQERNLKIRSYGYFEQLWRVFQGNGVYLFLLRHKNYTIGGALVIVFGNTCYNLYSAYRQKYLSFAEDYLNSVIMEWAANQKCIILEVINASEFNKKTSADTRLYTYMGEFDLVYSPVKYRIWNLLLPIYQWSMT